MEPSKTNLEEQSSNRNLAVVPSISAATVENVILKGDLAELTPEQRIQYCRAVCESVGLNYLTRPFEYITLNGKLTLYATKGCTDQLRSVHKISIEIVAREKVGDVYVVTARAKDPSGRVDESTGAVALGKAFGDSLANLYMKAETKAKRRVTLSICGLGLLDETEVESIPSASFQESPPKVASFPLEQPNEEEEMEDPSSLSDHELAKSFDYIVQINWPKSKDNPFGHSLRYWRGAEQRENTSTSALLGWEALQKINKWILDKAKTEPVYKEFQKHFHRLDEYFSRKDGGDVSLDDLKF